MSEETKQNPQTSGKPVERDEKGQFVEGHEKLGGSTVGSISLTTVVKRKLKEMSPDGKREAIEVLADNIIQDALDSSEKMKKLIWNYLDGMPKQSIEHDVSAETLEELTEFFKIVSKPKKDDKE